MIKHVVMWKFKKGEEAKVEMFLKGLQSLKGQIEEIKNLEVGKNSNLKNEYDAILISEFETMEDLEAYQKDPRHLEVGAIIKEIKEERQAIDYEY